MRVDWVPFSASALVAGATALSVGALMSPRTEDRDGTLRVLSSQDDRWLAVALLYFVASVALTAGLPSALTLFDKTGYRTCVAALGAFTVGTVGIAGYAMILAFFRALLLEEEIGSDAFAVVLDDPGLAVLLYSWVFAFYLGELLLSIALIRAKEVPGWVPAVLLVHVGMLPLVLLDALPRPLQAASALLITVGLAGVGIAANNRHALRP